MSYFINNDPRGALDPSYTYFNTNYSHSMDTFVGTPNLIVSNIRAVNIDPFNPSSFNLELKPDNIYFEIVGSS